MASTAWQCGICGTVYAPWVDHCKNDHRPLTSAPPVYPDPLPWRPDPPYKVTR